MEANWEFEIGGDAPVIDAAWTGFVDLRSSPGRVSEIAEVAELPALRAALLRLNGTDSPVGTAKCDVWLVDEFDPDEMDANRNEAEQGIACYLDLLAGTDPGWQQPDAAAEVCRGWVQALRAMPVRNCRADLVVRRAWITAAREGFGVTAYLTACGASYAVAQRSLSAALAAFADAAAPVSSGIQEASKYNEDSVGE
jgi:hypothetical protein